MATVAFFHERDTMETHPTMSKRSSLMEFSLQALLVRHETYVADAESQRLSMAAQLEELESQKKSLQLKNNDLVQENRGLLDQLEALNNAVTESDVSIAGLQATLQSAQQELQKLAILAARTESLERALSLFEHEQATWQTSLNAKEQAEKTAMRRWQDAERTLAKLQDELERIEKESREERTRHDEVLARMERRHAVEKELAGAAGRLKSSTSKDTGSSNVVSHFVKDILQDNATLQMGIVELREMLQNSNEEVEKLRDQLVLHHPVEENEDNRPAPDRTVSLGDELSKTKGQELHVHHHYHAPPVPVQRSNSLRRVKKKRLPSGSSAYLTPTSSGRSTPRSSISLGPGTAATILRQTAVSLPQDVPPNRRWSSQSLAPTFPVSLPGSPTSTTNRTSSLFDRVFSDAGNESTSPPTSEGEAFSSPYFLPMEARRPPSRKFSSSRGHARGWGSGPGKQSLDSIMDTSVEDLPPLDPQGNTEHETIEEEASNWDNQNYEDLPNSAIDDSSHDHQERAWHQPHLRRAASHESLLSISGMDIHTLKSRPSQMLIPNGGLSSSAVVSNLQVHAARPTGVAHRSSKSILSGMAADQRKVSAPLPSKQTLTKKSSGWFFGKWGATPEGPKDERPTTRASLGSSRRASSIASSNSDKAAAAMPKPMLVRSPGINQPGPIFGFLPETKIQHPPIVKSLDQDALKQVLDG